MLMADPAFFRQVNAAGHFLEKLLSWWKQVALAVVLVVVGGLAWLRLSPQAAPFLSRIGITPSLVAAVTGAPSGQNAGAGQRPAQGRPGRRPGGFNNEVLVVTAPVTTARINDRVTAIGDGEAKRSVSVVPLSSGLVRKVNIKAGDHVTAGTVIAELDSDAELIARDRAKLAMEMAKQKLGRYEQLVNSKTVSAVQLDEARSDYENTQLELRDNELKLDRRRIIAPIDGIAGIVPVEVGDYVTTQTQITTLDDRSTILVDFWVPERFAGTVKPGQKVEAVAIAMPGRRFSGVVAAVASRVDRDSRTLQIRAELDNSEDALRPGMSFKVTMRFPGEVFPAVNPLAIQWSSNGAFVWKEHDGVAAKTPVRIVQRNSDDVLVEGQVAEGEETVIEGVQTLREGSKLRIAGQTERRKPAAGS